MPLKKIAILFGALLTYAGGTENAYAQCASACVVQTGEYHIKLPENPAKNMPAVLFLHGYGGSGQSALKSSTVVNEFLENGYAVIAPDALRREGRTARGWYFHPDTRQKRDEIAFFDQVMSDASKRFNINRSNVLLAGFSIGGSMTAYVACQSPEMFKAYAPVGGNFWRPHPTSCEGPVKLLHTHGWRDSTVPLEGRIVGSGFEQGDVFYAMNILRKTNECAQPRANRFSQTDQFMRRKWIDCAPGSALEFALFPGGHKVPKGWSKMARSWFEGL